MARLTDVITGLEVLGKYLPDGIKTDALDTINDMLIGPDVSVTLGDEKTLEACGWFKSTEFKCWAKFV